MIRIVVVAVSFVLLAASCATKTPKGSAEPGGRPVSDRELGLGHSSVFDTVTPPPVVGDTSEPGARPAPAPAYAGAPPVIPHAVADFVPIISDSNACIDCHMVDEKIEGEPTPIPASHFTDLRNTPDEVGQQIVGARYRCTTCHIPQTETTPLVPNTF